MELEVTSIHWGEVYKDLARVPAQFRRDVLGNAIPEGAVCQVKVGKRTVLLSLRGQLEHKNPAIHMDERTRSALGVVERGKYEFNFKLVGFAGQFLWAWRAADPAYRIATRLGVISLLLGLMGLIIPVAQFLIEKNEAKCDPVMVPLASQPSRKTSLLTPVHGLTRRLGHGL